MTQHFLQSEAWGQFQRTLGNDTLRRDGDGWSYLAIVEYGGGLKRLYCPYGPAFSSFEALDVALVSLKTEAKAHSAAFIRVQPDGALLDAAEAAPRGLRPIEYSQPIATRRIDLTPSYEDLIAAISQSKRSIIRNYANKGLTYHSSTNPADIELLLPLLHDIAARNRIAVHDDEYVRKQAAALMPGHASLHFIQLNEIVVSAALLFEGADTNYYAHAGTATEHYKLQANTALLGELIRYSKDQGKRWLDLFGIAPTDDPNHPWAGVTHFKQEFGGEVVRYNQTYDVPVACLRYAVYEMLRVLKKRF